ncbi:MAG: indolepyruvate oxidoreductase subunit beta family protein [Pseudomonadota bacterium]
MDGSRVTDGEIIKLAIMAVGGQGGGVLTSWIEALALAHGWQVQATAVAGVAQRTGATIYYIEMAPDTGRAPVFSLAPSPGDIDILIAAEWMEAGRAVMRGFVTPDRTTLIASTHRALAVSEKIVPGDGSASVEEVHAAVDLAAHRVIAFDMQDPAVRAGSVISATLFGALAGSGALPFPGESYADVIRSGGRGVDASLAAFEAGRAGPAEGGSDEAPAVAAPGPAGPADEIATWAELGQRISALPDAAQEMARAGLRKVVDFQDVAYGADYLDHVDRIAALDPGAGQLTETAAKYIANAMAYDDVIRVADLKTRSARSRRIDAEMVRGDRAMQITEFMHPGIAEICGLMPARWGAWVEARPRLMGWLDRRIGGARHVRTDTIRGFAMLWLIAGRRRHRRGTLRHRIERTHMAEWLDLACETAPRDPALAIEILAMRRLIKGYSDTHTRGLSKYDRVLGALDMLAGRDDAADWLRRLREAALADEKGEALDGALATIRSFVGETAVP